MCIRDSPKAIITVMLDSSPVEVDATNELPYHNAVFIGYDENKEPKYAAYRATTVSYTHLRSVYYRQKKKPLQAKKKLKTIPKPYRISVRKPVMTTPS